MKSHYQLTETKKLSLPLNNIDRGIVSIQRFPLREFDHTL
jgi:hypothetical protein